jgi:hypothetical protein
LPPLTVTVALLQELGVPFPVEKPDLLTYLKGLIGLK